MKVSPWILFLLSWTTFLTWNEGWLPVLQKAPVEIGDWVEWPPAIYVEGTIYLAPAATGDLDELEWALLHEVQHYLASKGRPYSAKDWEKFERVAMLELRRGDYTKKQVEDFKHYCSYGAYEGHAQLPWILEGEIPPELQRWYPWFDLGGKEKRR